MAEGLWGAAANWLATSGRVLPVVTDVVEHLLETADVGVVAKERRLADASATAPHLPVVTQVNRSPLVPGERTPNHQIRSHMPRVDLHGYVEARRPLRVIDPEQHQNLPSAWSALNRDHI